MVTLTSLLSVALFSATSLACYESMLGLQKRSGGKVPFSYTGETGPLIWGELDKEQFGACAVGQRQSPINLNTSMPTETVTRNELEYPAIWDNVVLKHTDHGIEFDLGEGVAAHNITLDGKEYTFQQGHFHTPSEHRLDEEYFAMELHLVHKHADDDFAVVGFFFDPEDTCPNNFLAPIHAQFNNIKNKGDEVKLNGEGFGGLNFTYLNNAVLANPLLTYPGSLTTPPCSEVVTFYISPKPIPMTNRQFRDFKHMMKFNSRYTQAGFNPADVAGGGAAARTNLLVLASKDICSLSFPQQQQQQQPEQTQNETTVVDEEDEKHKSM